MSKMADVSLEIEQLLEEGYNPMSISVRLQVPLHFVYDVLEALSMQDEVDN
jgi:hypothetical protein